MSQGKITSKQQEILQYIKDMILRKGYPPTVREICEAVHLKSTSSVHSHLETLERNGYIRRDPTKPRAMEILDDTFGLTRREMVQVPVIGTVAAGQPILAEENIKARVVSIPCMEIFDAQSEEYKEKVLPKSVKARVCVEAASHFAWYKYCRDYGELITMTSFGVSGPAKQLFKHFGFTAENIVEKAKLSIENVKNDKCSH